MVLELESQEQLTEIMSVAGDKLVIVDFWAQWCGPCKIIGPEFDRLSKDAKYKEKVVFVKVDVDDLPELAEESGIEMMPTFIFYRHGVKIDQMAGTNKDHLREYVEKYVY